MGELGDFVEDALDEVGDFVGDAWDDTTDWVEEDIFGAPSDGEIAQMEQQAAAAAAAAAAAGQTTVPTGASDIRAERKKRLAEIRSQSAASKAGALAEQKGKSTGIVAGMRTGTGGIKSTKGAEKRRVRAQKYKGSRPLKLGMKRP